jgi:rhamnosyltransferase subunit B
VPHPGDQRVLPPVARAARIVLSTFGSAGDVYPFIALAAALEREGAAPVIAAPPLFAGAVRAAGIAFHPVGPDLEALQKDLGLSEAGLVRAALHPRDGTRFIVAELLMPYLRTSLQDLAPVLEKADLLAVHALGFAARLAAEERGLPWAGVVLQPMAFLSAYDPPVLPGLGPLGYLPRRLPVALNRMLKWLARRLSAGWLAPLERQRAALGLPAGPGHPLIDGQFSPWLNLALYSPLLGGPQPDHPPHTLIAGSVCYDGPPVALPAPLEAFLADGPAPIVFTLGSSADRVPGAFFAVSAAVAADLGERAVLVSSALDAGTARRESPDLLHCGPLPYSMLFPHARALVHQGGIGTLTQALRAGRPQLIVPFAHDQPDNARRAAALGCAQILPQAAYDRRRARAAIRTLLAWADRDEAARRVARAMAGEAGAVAAARALLRLR